MKKIVLIFIMLFLVFFCAFATEEEESSNSTTLTLLAVVPPGQGVEPAPENSITVGDVEKTFLFYFTPFSATHTIEKNSLKLENESPEIKDSITLDMYYSGNESLTNENNGKHTITIHATQWVHSSDKSISNDIYVTPEGNGTDGLIEASHRSIDDNVASIYVRILSNTLVNKCRVGAFTFSWDDNTEVGYGSYDATLTITIGSV